MAKDTVSLALADQLRPEVIAMSGNIDAMMTGNSDYLTPNPTLLALKAARDAEVAATQNVLALESELAQARVIEDLCIGTHDGLLTQMGSYAENITNYDGAKLTGGGFPLAKQPAPIGELPAPVGLETVAGPSPGLVTGKCKRVVGGKTYVAEWSSSPSGPWTRFYTGTKARWETYEMTSGAICYFRMAAIGAAGQSPWSDISEKRAP